MVESAEFAIGIDVHARVPVRPVRHSIYDLSILYVELQWVFQTFGVIVWFVQVSLKYVLSDDLKSASVRAYIG